MRQLRPVPYAFSLAAILTLSWGAALAGETLQAQAAASEPIALKVVEIQVIPAYVPPARDPNVDHLFATPLLTAAESWVRSHVKAVGTSYRAMVVIREASVTETKLPIKTGISGLLNREPSERYDAVLRVEIEIRDNFDKFEGKATARITRSQTVLEDTEPEERQTIWKRMTAALISDLNKELTRQTHRHLSGFAR